MFSLSKGLVNNREAGDLRRHRAHYDVIVMKNGVFTTAQLLEDTSHLAICDKLLIGSPEDILNSLYKTPRKSICNVKCTMPEQSHDNLLIVEQRKGYIQLV